ncbi:50S ribosomal protein L7/L12 [bacterium]|jgi:large subunit ribosomal protein L7/L12|nr:50S ribosomal protein L7/L12 [bacterium]MBT3903478.1 50S ribosomal protein L7/L12 [bacterium]MBT4577542.1 50S ribosomal protein L7/L12 [bacterium]MBT5345824.1 50S ribosomal protein L7/L12 [bacterium]MBT6131288.1 50S ribosomal protein L7/L12 [bacterium]
MSAKSFDNMISEIGSMSVLELADLVKALEDKFGVSAAMPVAAAAVAGGDAVQAEEKTEFKVTLQETGAAKIKVIKAVRVINKELSLIDAKKLVESAPVVIAESASKEDADKMKKALEDAGAKVLVA